MFNVHYITQLVAISFTCFTTWEALCVMRYSAASMALRTFVTLIWKDHLTVEHILDQWQFILKSNKLHWQHSLAPHRQVTGHPLQLLDTLAQCALCQNTKCYRTTRLDIHSILQRYVTTLTNTATTNTHQQSVTKWQQLTRALTYFCHH